MKKNRYIDDWERMADEMCRDNYCKQCSYRKTPCFDLPCSKCWDGIEYEWRYKKLVILAFLLLFISGITFVFVRSGVPDAMESVPAINTIYDINQDGDVTDADAEAIYSVWLDGKQVTPDMLNRCDVNKDGFVDELDTIALMDYIKEVQE